MDNTKDQPSVDVVNAASRLSQKIDGGAGYDDAFSEISRNFNLTAKEMDQLEILVPYRYK